MYRLMEHIVASATGGDSKKPLEEVLETYSKMGYPKFELYAVGRGSSLDITKGTDYYLQMAKKYGITYSSLHLAPVEADMGETLDHAVKCALFGEKLAAIPYPTGRKKVYMAGVVNGDIIFKNTKHPKEAWKFISFLASKNSQRYWNQKIGQIPTNTQLLNEDWVKNAQHLSALGNAFAAQGVILAQQPEYLPDYKNIRVKVMDPGFQAVLAGIKTAKQFLDEVAGALEKSNNAYWKMVKK